jgi:Putative DNA-binding domain
MDYASVYFGTPLEQLTYDAVEKFFATEREETDQLEFKSYNVGESPENMMTGVIEGIAAFLNSAGGVLVWGAPRGVRPPAGSGRKEKIFTGELTHLPVSIEKDWLVSKVSDRIIPLPNGIRVKLIRKNDHQVCVFEVDESRTSPHQTGGTYYMRIDGQKKPAPHHYVEALMKKITFPDIETYITPHSLNDYDWGYTITVDFNFMNFSIFENEEGFHYKIIVSPGVFANATEQNAPNTLRKGYDLEGGRFSYAPAQSQLSYGEVMQETKTFHFTHNQLLKSDKIAKIFLTFGGKKSPIKVSEYSINFNDISIGNLRNPKTIFSIVYQNKLISELNAERGHTKVSTLRGMNVLR